MDRYHQGVHQGNIMNNNYIATLKKLSVNEANRPISNYVLETKQIVQVSNEREAVIKVLEERKEFLPYSKESFIASRLERLGLHNKAFSYEQCGELVTGYQCERCGSIEYKPTSSCNLRICDRCCKKLFYRLWSKYWPQVRKMKNPKLLTLTFGFTPIMRPEVVAEFRKMFFKFRKKMKINSGVYVFETKRSPYDIKQIETHIHALVDTAYIPQTKTSEAWSEISGRFVTDIRKAYGCRGGLGYIMKYVLKPPQFPIAQDYACYEFMFNNRRRIQGFGDCFGVETSLVDMEIICQFCGSKMVVFEHTSCWMLKNKLREGIT